MCLIDSPRLWRLALPALLLFLLPMAPLATAAEIWWIGAGENNNWTNPDNWMDEEGNNRLPGEGDTVRLGYADGGNVADAHQTINFDAVGTITVDKLWFDNEGNRSVDLIDTRGVSTNRLAITSADGDRVALKATATADARVGLVLNAIRTLSVETGNAQFIFGVGSNWIPPDTSRLNFTRLDTSYRPIIRVEGLTPFQWRPGHAEVDVIVDLSPDANPSFSSEIIHNVSGVSYFFASDASIGSFWPTDGTGVVNLYRLGTEDRVFTTASISGGRSGSVQIHAGEPGQGHFTLRTATFAADTGHVVTSADSTVEIYQASRAANWAMKPADNPGITGEGNLRLKMDAAETTFSIARDMTYTGRTILERGVLSMAWVDGATTYYGSLPNGTIVEISANAALNLAGTSQTVGGLIGYDDGETITYGSVQLGGGTLTINSTTSTSFGGQFSGGGSVIKSGSETFTITGTNSYNGSITVGEGILAVNGALTGATVNVSGGTLGGSGTLGGPVTIASGGILSPGNSPGTISFAGDLAFKAGATVDFEIGSNGSDLIVLNGSGQTLSSGGDLFWQFIPNGSINANVSYLLIDWSEATGLDVFDFLLSDMKVANSGWNAFFSFSDDGLTVTFGVVPEPAHIASILAAVALLLALRRRRR